MSLGKLNKVELRKVWSHEALDFTPWLAKDINMILLSKELWLDIKIIDTEVSVWSFNVDILAEEESTWRKIIIENQLESTDHDHLWKIITYASWLDAEIVIWIVKDVRDEHKQAIDWLNENTNIKINFFIIKIEAWKIWDSEIAPKFNIISKPNDWSKFLKSMSFWVKKLTEINLLQIEFWNKLKNYLNEKNVSFNLWKPLHQNWYNIAIGSWMANIALLLNSKNKSIWIELYIYDSKDLYDYLFDKKDEFESKLNIKFIWKRLDNKKASIILFEKENSDFKNKNLENELLEWFYNWIPKIHSIFSKNVKEYKELNKSIID